MLNHIRYHKAQARDIGKDESVASHVECQREDEVNAQLLGDVLEYVLNGLEPPEPEIYRLQLHGYTIAEVLDLVLSDIQSSNAEILQLRLQGQTIEQISESVGCSRATTRYRLERICERLKCLIGKNNNK
jgi:DNA-directed RNA polymerase specialized sigma24 family protein